MALSFVVGYASGALQSGSTAIGAQFTAVGGEAMDLTNVKPVGYNVETYVGGSISVQSLGPDGRVVPGSQYFWYDDEDGTGWFDLNDELVNANQVMIAPGEALWTSGNSSDEGIQSSGQVANTAIAVTLRKGSKLICNPTPIALPWGGEGMITATGYDIGSYVGGSINVQQLTNMGRVVPGSQYFWYDDEDGTGWFDLNDELVEDGTLPAGAGIWVSGNSVNESIVFPSAL